MKRRTPLRYVRIQSNARPSHDCRSTSQTKRIDVAAWARAIVRALRDAGLASR
jgi:hypothetical protein